MSFGAYLLYLILTYLRPVDMFAPELATYRPMVILWIFAFVTAVVQASGRREVASRAANFALLALLIGTIAMSRVVNRGGAIFAAADFSTSAMLFVLTALNLTSVDRVRKTCTVLLVCMVVLALFGITAYHFGFMSDELLVRQSTEVEGGDLDIPGIPAQDTANLYLWRVRSLGFLNDPNDFGQAMVMVLPFLWGLYERRRTLRRAIMAAIPGATLFYAIYLTHSRGAVIGSVALLSFAMHRALGTVRLIALISIAAVAISSSSLGERGFTAKEESASQRIDAWWAGIQMLRHQPILGVGYGSFTDYHDLTAHNSFVLCFAELGIVGYFLWIGMLVIAYKGMSQVIARAPSDSVERKQATLLRSSFVGFMACAWFLSRTYQPGLFLLLALCASIAWCGNDRYGRLDAASRWKPVPWVGATFLAMLLSFCTVYGFVVLN